MNPSPEFGTVMHMLVLTVKGVVTEGDCAALSAEIVEAIGMRSVGVHTFPYEGEEVGVIHVRGLYESFLAIDTWYPRLPVLYVHIASCKAFENTPVFRVLEGHGLSVAEFKRFKLGL